MDYGHAETDRMLKGLEKKIAKEYAQAEKEVQAKLDDYLRRYKVKDEIKRKKLAAGEITRKEYNDWRTGQIMIGKRWEEMRDTLAEDLHNTNKIANSMAREFSYDAYALNHNYGTFEVEKGSLVDTSYTLYDRSTVERLVRDNPDMLPPPGKKTSQRIREGKDVLWNKQHIQSVMTQSILQGESIPKIASRLAMAVGDSNRASAIRNARTMTTGAENAGRVDSYKRAVDMGIKVKQVWVATLDSRTRHSHRELDGEEIDVAEGEKDAYFSNGCRFPGDPHGDPSEVYNCRCTLIADVGQPFDVRDLGSRNTDHFGYTSYEGWQGMSFDDWTKAHQATADASLGSAKTLEDIRRYFVDTYGMTVSDEIMKLEFEHVKHAAQGIDDTMQEFPELKGQIKALDVRNAGYMCSNGENVNFNPTYFKKGYPFDANEAYQAGAHESGHCLDMAICKKEVEKKNPSLREAGIRLLARSDWNSNAQAQKIVRKAINNVKKSEPAYNLFTNKELRNCISNYATTDTSETLAEAVGYEMLLNKRGVNGYRRSELGHEVGSEIFKLVTQGIRGKK